MAIGQLLMAGPTRRKKPLNVSELMARERGQVKADEWLAGPERARAIAAGEAGALADATGRARGRSEKNLGVPAGYEPGVLGAAERPDSYFVRDPTARAQLEAKERVAGRDLMTSGSGNTAMGDPFGLSRGTGLPPRGEGLGGASLRGGATYAINPLQPGMSFTGRAAGTQIVPEAAATEVPEARAAWGQPGLEGLAGGTGYARLSGSYLTPEQAVMQAQKEGEAFQQRIKSPYGPQAVAALRSQGGPWEGRKNIEQIATEQAGSALMRAQAAAGAAVAPQMAAAEVAKTEAETRAFEARGELERKQTESLKRITEHVVGGKAEAMKAVQDALDSAIASGAPPEVVAVLRDIQMGQFGMRRVDPGVLEQVYAMLRPYAALFGGILAGPAGAIASGILPPTPAPSYQPTPSTGAGLIAGPTAQPAAPAAGTGPVAGTQVGGPPMDVDEANITPEQIAATEAWLERAKLRQQAKRQQQVSQAQSGGNWSPIANR
jgi:hypothetical protein